MSTVQIVVGSVSAPFSDKGHTKLDLNYSQGGKDTSRKLVRIGDTTDTFDVIKDAKRGDTFDIEMIKKGEFWNWVKATKVEGGAQVTHSTPQSTTKSTYETSEERKQRQLYIARQSCIGYAVNLLNVDQGKTKRVTVKEVIETAQEFVDYVYGVHTQDPETNVDTDSF